MLSKRSPAGKRAGITVSIGARVASMAAPSEVLVSQTVKDLVAGSGFSFEDSGEHELKGVPDRWRLYALFPDRSRGEAWGPPNFRVSNTPGGPGCRRIERVWRSVRLRGRTWSST